MKNFNPLIEHKRKVCLFAVLVFAAFLFTSCSLVDDEDDEGGSVTFVLPGASTASRSISTGGTSDNSVPGHNNYTYSVYLRRASDKVTIQKESGLLPGSEVTIDKIPVGTYTVAIRKIMSSGSSSFVENYGVSSPFTVNEGESSSATVSMFYASGSLTIRWYGATETTCTVTATCEENGDSFTDSVTFNDSNYYTGNPSNIFIEPGFTYTVTVSGVGTKKITGAAATQCQYEGQTGETVSYWSIENEIVIGQ